MEDFTSKDETVQNKSIEELEEEMGLYIVSPEKINSIFEDEEQWKKSGIQLALFVHYLFV